MFDPKELEILETDEARLLLEKHIEDNPNELSITLKCERNLALAVCRQIKYLQKCRVKIPEYFNARCIIPPISFEQASSGITALSKEYSGKLCIDLTCGLGVDSYFFSKKFGQVISIEKNKVLSEIAKLNFKSLGAENITVINKCAEDFITDYTGPKADVLYIDPARRDDKGGKKFLLEDCSPDIQGIIEQCLKISERTVIKLSPLFDIKEITEKFSTCLDKIDIISVRDECKEVIAECSSTNHKPVTITVNAVGGKKYDFSIEDSGVRDEKISDIESYNYLLVPDVCFYKGRLTVAYFKKYLSDTDISTPSSTGFSFSKSVPYDFCGKAYKITELTEYNPKKVRNLLKGKGIKNLTILKKDFQFPLYEITKALKIGTGGNNFAAVTTVNGKKYFMLLGNKELFL
ncbi:MAG: hypothetical protein LUF90_01360 [Rikenellaceae bacterium]|nr:hypothetical protein [Rikenellaceae bacterium]